MTLTLELDLDSVKVELARHMYGSEIISLKTYCPETIKHRYTLDRLLYLENQHTVVSCNYFARGSGGEVFWWERLCVCLSVCLSDREDIRNHTRDL